MSQGYRHFEQARDYAFGCPDGVWTARLDRKAWGKNKNMILYFTETDTGAKRWLSVFWNDKFRPRDGGFDFRNEGARGDLFTLTTTHNPKTGNPVFTSARRFVQPRPTKIMFRSQGFIIGENVLAGRPCSECKEISTVYAVYLPPGHERFDTPDGQPRRINSPGLLTGVTYLSERPIRILEAWSVGDYRLHNGRYWLNHCEECGAVLNDWEDHQEPGGAFFPTMEAEARDISLHCYDQQIEAVADDITHDVPFANEMWTRL